MSERLIVTVDIDDVLFATAQSILDHYGETYGVSVDPADFYSKEPSVWGVEDYSEATSRVCKYLASQAFSQREPIDQAYEGLTALRQNGARLIPLTGRDDTQREATNRLLKRSFAGVFHQETIFSNYFNDRRRTKGELCYEYGADYHIDDHIDHINSLSALAEYATRGVLYGEYAWSKVEPAAATILEAPNWTVLPELILSDYESDRTHLL